jgi:tRNA A-37 threonylcarbamoyl transferase component Bud32
MRCFDENVALQFVEGLLDDEDARQVELHIAECDECRFMLAAAGGALMEDSSCAPTQQLDDGAMDGDGPPVLQLIGTRLAGTYRLERLIGRGGMATVFEATHARLPRRFAVKLMTQSLQTSPEAIERMRREAEVASRLEHENLVDVVDFNVTDDGVPFIVMELLAGEPLARRLQRERVIHSVADFVAIVRQVTAGVSAAHERNIVHRDLKPTNIFLCASDAQQPRVKVMDFGISKIIGVTAELTRDMAVLGSPGYMSPEQARGTSSEVDWRADIFAMGAIMYRMLAGAPPFAGGSIPATLYRVVHEAPRPTERWREVPRPLRQVVLRAMSKRPAARQPSMSQLWRELSDAMHAMGGGPLVEEPGEVSGDGVTVTDLSAPFRWRWVGLLLAAALVALGGVAVYIARSGPDTPRAAASRADTTPAQDAAVSVEATPADRGVDRRGRADMRPVRAPGVRRRGHLTVQSKSAIDGEYLWADVLIDGRRVGRTPLVRFPVATGPHRVSLRRPGFGVATRRVVVTAGRTVVLGLSLSPAQPERPTGAPVNDAAQ